jgi:acetamidase/formamidase
VASDDTVSFDCLDASNGQITASSTSSTLSTLDFSKLDQVNGPVYVTDAKAGDVLRIEVLELETAEWGWTGLIPGFGLLSNEFDSAELKIWKLQRDEEGPFAWFDEEKGIRVPLRPFCGEMGVAPGKEGAHSTIPPYRTGGNLDTKYLTKGAVLYLPVEVDGALFSIGVCLILNDEVPTLILLSGWTCCSR